MSYIVVKQFAIIVSIVFATGGAQAGNLPPHILQEPVLGLRYEIAKTNFEPLPANLLAQCVKSDNEHDRYWIFAHAHKGASSYYVVGGYGIANHPEPPDFPKYTPYDHGGIYLINNNRCTELGEAREVFDEAPFDDMPEAMIHLLAVDLVVRLEHGFGGANRLGLELRNQHVDFDRLPPALHEALKKFTQKNGMARPSR